jgi:hypothetical protein
MFYINVSENVTIVGKTIAKLQFFFYLNRCVFHMAAGKVNTPNLTVANLLRIEYVLIVFDKA